MYKAADGLTELGGHSDVSRLQREEAFHAAYRAIKDGTIPDKKALADELITDEKLMESIYQRAYIGLSSRLKHGNRLLEAVKKVLTSRMIALEVFRKDLPNGSIEGKEVYEGDDRDDDDNTDEVNK
jgi:hypothetical protein